MNETILSKDKSLTEIRQHPDEKYYEELLQRSDAAHQNITYWKHGKFVYVHALRFVPIDLQKALRETEELLHEYSESIGFSNGRNKDAISITRIADDQWDVEVPVFTRDQWDGYWWRASTDTKKIMDVIKMFFEELEWFGMLDFKMGRRSKHT